MFPPINSRSTFQPEEIHDDRLDEALHLPHLSVEYSI